MSVLEVLLDEPNVDFDGEYVQFRLTYYGPLPADTLRGGGVRRARATDKHAIRKQLHPQLKELWKFPPLKRSPRDPKKAYFVTDYGTEAEKYAHTEEALSARFVLDKYHLVPLATLNLDLLCSIEIMVLLHDKRAGVRDESSGDLDNRIKTLCDALTMPRVGQLDEYPVPGEDEDPFYCLLENDSIISRLTVETDRLLVPVSETGDKNTVDATIAVKLWPGHIQVANFGFA
jgi:hypothetical protein